MNTRTVMPKETLYRGINFKTEIEAKWAVFFDAAEIPYEYQNDPFTLADKREYRPSFFLPWFDAYLTVIDRKTEWETICWHEESMRMMYEGDPTGDGCMTMIIIGTPVYCEKSVYCTYEFNGETDFAWHLFDFYVVAWYRDERIEYGDTKHWVSINTTNTPPGMKLYNRQGVETLRNGFNMYHYRSRLSDAAMKAENVQFGGGYAPGNTL